MVYKFLEHTADLKIRVEAKSLEKAFSESANALREAIAEKIKVGAKLRKEINIFGKDKESLLYNFLEEFLFLLDAEGFLLSKVENLKIEKTKKGKGFELKFIALGDLAKNYKFSNDVKAITYNEMKILENKKSGKTVIEFVVDV
jgi:SHS2 domain-containing protein